MSPSALLSTLAVVFLSIAAHTHICNVSVTCLWTGKSNDYNLEKKKIVEVVFGREKTSCSLEKLTDLGPISYDPLTRRIDFPFTRPFS